MDKKMALNEKAVLVHFTVNSPGTTKMDKDVSKEVQEKYQASENPGRYFKRLFQREDVKAIWSAINRSKRTLTRYSLPWFDGGVRIMPVGLLEKFLKENAVTMKEYDIAVKDFIENYDSIMKANEQRLNGLFDKDDYPTKEEAKASFGIRIGYMPLPDREDFRITAPDTVIADMKKKYDKGLKEAESRAKAEIADRLQNAIKNLVDKLSAEDKNIRETTFSRIETMVQNLRALNITGDAKIESLLKETEKSFSKETAEALNENAALRGEKKLEAKAVLEKVETFRRSLLF